MSIKRIVTHLASVFIALSFLAGPAVAGEVAYTGKFKGAGGKKATGSYEIFKEDGQTKIRLSKDFTLSRVPDPKLAFGNGKYTKGTIYVKLKKLKGSQTYVIPSRLDPSKFSQVWIWCEKFSVPLAVASLEKN